MKKEVSKPEKVALCRECRGTGKLTVGKFVKEQVRCPHCEGSGRVFVSCRMSLDIRPYRVE